MKYRILCGIVLLSLVASIYTLISYGELYFIQQNNRVNEIIAALVITILVDIYRESKANFLKSSFSFFAVFMSSFILVIAFCIIKQIIFEPVYFSDIPSRIELKKNEEITLNAYKVLSEKDWRFLSKSEKLNLLQTVVNHEVAELKLKDSPNIEAAEIPAKGTDLVTNAQYNRLFDKIIIRSSLLDMSGDRALQSAIHEVRHAYQNSLARAYEENNIAWMSEDIMNDARKFSKSLTNKRENVQNYDQYYNELVERDAREYAARRMKKYYHMIYDCVEGIPELSELK